MDIVTVRTTGVAIALMLFANAISVAADGQVRTQYGAVAETFRTEKLAEGVYGFMAPDSKTPFVSGNSLAVIGRTGVLVVDSGHVPAVTRRIIADIKRLTDRPVRFLVNTHWHFDHLVGNGEYAAAFPGLTIVSTPSTRTQIEAQVPGYPAGLATRVPPGIENLRQMLKDGKKRDGSAVTDEDREFYEAEIHDFTAALPAVAEMKYAPPTLTFDRELTVDLGDRVARVLFLGRGNTAGDAVVYVPDAKVVATGDLVVAPVPYATGAFMFEWPETMRKLMALDATAIVPGHGPVLHDWSYAARVTALVEAVGAQVTKAVAEGLSLDEAKRRVDVAGFRQEFAGSDQFQRRIFDTFFLPGAIDHAYKEATLLAEK